MATSNEKIKEIPNELGRDILDSSGVYMRDDKFTSTAGIFNLHLTKGTHWVMFTRSASCTNQNYFDSYSIAPPVNSTKQINGGIYSDYQNQKNDSYRAAFFMFLLYLASIIIGFKKQY